MRSEREKYLIKKLIKTKTNQLLNRIHYFPGRAMLGVVREQRVQDLLQDVLFDDWMGSALRDFRHPSHLGLDRFEHPRPLGVGVVARRTEEGQNDRPVEQKCRKG